MKKNKIEYMENSNHEEKEEIYNDLNRKKRSATKIVISAAIVCVIFGVIFFISFDRMKEKADLESFKFQASVASANLIVACDDNERLDVADMQNVKKKSEYSFLNEQSFEVLSENCELRGDGTFAIKIEGKNGAKGNSAICSNKKCIFFDTQLGNKWLSTTDVSQENVIESENNDEDPNAKILLGLSTEESARMVKLEGSYKCVEENSDEEDDSVKINYTIFISDGRLALETIFTYKDDGSEETFGRLIYADGLVHYIDDGYVSRLYVWEPDFLDDNYGVNFGDVDYVNRFIHSNIGDEDYSCAPWTADNKKFAIPKIQKERANSEKSKDIEDLLFNL